MDREGLGDQLDNQEAEEFHKLAKVSEDEEINNVHPGQFKLADLATMVFHMKAA